MAACSILSKGMSCHFMGERKQAFTSPGVASLSPYSQTALPKTTLVSMIASQNQSLDPTNLCHIFIS